jgi:2-isopropylmalate synthase
MSAEITPFVPRPDAAAVVQFDTTLRDGDQSEPESHRFPDGTKPEIAGQIARLGTRTIEAGFPATSGDAEEVIEVARTVGRTPVTFTPKRIENGVLVADESRTFTPIITGLSLAKVLDVETTWDAVKEADNPGIHIFLATDERNMRTKHPGMTRQDTLDMFREAVRHAREIGGPDLTLEVSCELATTTDQAWLERVSRTLLADEEARIDVLNLPDTIGRADAQHMYEMFHTAAGWVVAEGRAGDVTLSTHNHDDRGRAVDNSIAAIRGVVDGARAEGALIPRIQVEGANGDYKGERVRNTNHALFSLDFLMALDDGRVAVPVEYLVDTEPTKEVAEAVMAASGLDVHPRSHVVGGWTNRVFSGVHAGAAAKARSARIYSAYDPTWFGHEVPMVIGDGKYQGARGKANIGDMETYDSEMVATLEEVAGKIATLGMELPDEEALERVVIARNTRAIEEDRLIADSEIEAFVAAETGEQLVDRVTDYEFSNSEKRRGSSHADVYLEARDWTRTLSAEADTEGGSVDAMVKAANKILGFRGNIKFLKLVSLEEGSDAGAGVIATVIDAENGHEFTAHGRGGSENEASFDAYVAAYNLIQRVEGRKAAREPA